MFKLKKRSDSKRKLPPVEQKPKLEDMTKKFKKEPKVEPYCEPPVEVDDVQLRKQIEELIRPEREWSSRSDEVSKFRENINKARDFIQVDKEIALKPPIFITKDPMQGEIVKKGFICYVNLPEKKMRKAIKCSGDMSVDDFAKYFFEKLSTTHKMEGDFKDFIFKAAGSCEFIYGETKMLNFDYIRTCVRKGHRPELKLLLKKDVFAKVYDFDIKIKGITYDFMYTKKKFEFKHEDFKMENKSWENMKYISMWDLNRPFRVSVYGVDTIYETDLFKEKKINTEDCAIYCAVELLHGGNSIAKTKFTKSILYNNAPRFNQQVEFDDIMICDLPKETKICFTIYLKPYNKSDATLDKVDGTGSIGAKDIPLCMVCSTLLDHKGQIKQGIQSSHMWMDERATPLSTCAENLQDDYSLPPCVLTFEYENFALPVVFPTGEPPEFLQQKLKEYEIKLAMTHGKISVTKQKVEIDRILETDPLYKLKEEEKWRIWCARDILKDNPHGLAKFLLSVPWQHPYAVFLAHNLIDEWKDVDPIDALELLDYNFGDEKVRQYALGRLNNLGDLELSKFLLQLVQTLKYELNHDSALARFLLQRGLRNTTVIGHTLYWHLASEMHMPSVRERHGLILDEYLSFCGSHRVDLIKQNFVLRDLNKIALKIKDTKKGDQVPVLRAELEKYKLAWPKQFKLPLCPRLEVKGIKTHKCKVMDSKKLPLWLVFENADQSGNDVYIIFKEGDDLRQDLLTLQMLSIMDQIWKNANLDLHIQAYGCVCTGYMTGMIEVVLNSDTIANITSARGGASAAFSVDPLEVWLKKYNGKKDQWDICVENFVYSCAGYCVATYVLGIGDRHNDNIMLTKKGDLFHIDFGHFLGHFKSFAGIKRETTPFVFTPMYAHVMGGRGSEQFNKYQSLGSKAFNITRKNGKIIMNLFLLMLATGIPELTSVDDIMWLRKCLVMEKTEEEAVKHFHDCVKASLNNTRAKINDAVHIIAHKGLLKKD